MRRASRADQAHTRRSADFREDEAVLEHSPQLAGQLSGAHQYAIGLWVRTGLRRISDPENGLREWPGNQALGAEVDHADELHGCGFLSRQREEGRDADARRARQAALGRRTMPRKRKVHVTKVT